MIRWEIGSQKISTVFRKPRLMFRSRALSTVVSMPCAHTMAPPRNKGRTVLTRTHYWYQHEPCWYVRKKNAPWFGKAGENSTIWDSPSPKFIRGGSGEEKYDHPTQKPVDLMRRPILNHTKRGELVYEPFLGSGTTLAAAEQRGRYRRHAGRRRYRVAGVARSGVRGERRRRIHVDGRPGGRGVPDRYGSDQAQGRSFLNIGPRTHTRAGGQHPHNGNPG